MYTDIVYILLSMYLATSFPLQKCFVSVVGRFPLALKCRWVGGGGEQSTGCKLLTDRCSVLSDFVQLTLWLNGPFQHLDTLSTWDCRQSCRALSLSHPISLYPFFSVQTDKCAQLFPFEHILLCSNLKYSWFIFDSIR